jgi:Tfp pilus assembly protein PilF
MKKIFILAICTGILFPVTGFVHAQGKSIKKSADDKKTMKWTTSSPKALDIALKGAFHLMNLETIQAYDDFTEALKLDPNFTEPLVFMTNMSRGETRKAYRERAIKSAANKTEGEKLFVTLIDENTTQEKNRNIWAKLHEMFPDGGMIGYYYVVTRATPEERFAAAEDYIKKFPDNPGMYNLIAYYYMLDKKDNEMAKKNFEKYIALYPDGINPYDSMGEFYMTTGDMKNAEKYYMMALEKYPYNRSSLDALQKINDAKPKAESNN